MKLLAAQNLPTLPFVVCDDLGSILRSGSAPAQMIDMQAQAGEHVFVGTASQITQFIDLAVGAVANKPQIEPIASGLSISNLPDGCLAIVEDQEFVASGGEITFDFAIPGTYQVILTAKNWLDAIQEVVQP